MVPSYIPSTVKYMTFFCHTDFSSCYHTSLIPRDRHMGSTHILTSLKSNHILQLMAYHILTGGLIFFFFLSNTYSVASYNQSEMP